jgi:hypothetical protein
LLGGRGQKSLPATSYASPPTFDIDSRSLYVIVEKFIQLYSHPLTKMESMLRYMMITIIHMSVQLHRSTSGPGARASSDDDGMT